jgi:hypothetical protein
VLASTEVRNPIERDSKGNVTRVREVCVGLGLAINYNLFPEEFLIDGAIEDILNGITIAAGIGMGVSILQLICESLVFHHHLKLIL